MNDGASPFNVDVDNNNNNNNGYQPPYCDNDNNNDENHNNDTDNDEACLSDGDDEIGMNYVDNDDDDLYRDGYFFFGFRIL